MYKLILILAGLGLIVVFATAALAETPGAQAEPDLLTAEAAQEALSEIESTEGQAPAEKGVKAATAEQRKGKGQGMKKERKRGLDRADEAAGERGKQGRAKAREKQQR